MVHSQIRKLLASLGLALLLLSQLTLAGDYVGNGGGLGEQNLVFTWSQLGEVTRIIASNAPVSAPLGAIAVRYNQLGTSALKIVSRPDLPANTASSLAALQDTLATRAGSANPIYALREQLQWDSPYGMQHLEVAAAGALLVRALCWQLAISPPETEDLVARYSDFYRDNLTVRELSRLSRPEIRLLSLKTDAHFLDDGQKIVALDSGNRICAAMNYKAAGAPQLFDLNWEPYQEWDAQSGFIYLAVRASAEAHCVDGAGAPHTLGGELVIGLAFSVRDQHGSRLKFDEARKHVADAQYSLQREDKPDYQVRNVTER